MLEPVLSNKQTFRSMFVPGGTGGILAIANIERSRLVELSNEETRATADFAALKNRARTDSIVFAGLRELALEDLRRSGLPNETLRKFAADLLDGSISKPTTTKGKKPHLEWRDTLIANLFADAFVFGFPEYRNTKAKPGHEKRSTCDVVIKALEDIASLSPSLVEKVWTDNRHRVFWHFPELPENL
ncbi:MAG: hypothetical protein ABJX32_11355 [Tateyamaria sp.]|uniref:hypothetical protein n=1 Tax=Tateyamaria sp. TaxID=1929288 RepID=UPI00329DD129